MQRRARLIYGAGDLTIAIPLSVIAFFQLYFMTDVAGLNPALAGWALLVGKAWDAVNDPLLGIAMDRTRSRMGSRRLFIAVGLVPMAAGFWGMWQVPSLPQVLLAAYYSLMIILFDSSFTMVHVGYNAITPELSHDYDERTAINGVRMVFQLVGTLGSIILLTVIGWVIPDPRLLYGVTSIGLIVLMLPPQLGVLAVTRGMRRSQPVALTPARMIRETLRNRPFVMLVAIYLLSWTSASILSAALVYYARYYLGRPDVANYLVLCAQGSAIVFMPVMVRLSRRLDKRRAFLVGNATWVAATLGISLLPAGAVGAAFVLAGACGMGIATAYLIPWSMIPDIIELDQETTGERREGAYYAFASFFQKLGTAIALWLMGISLDAAGYATDPFAAPVVQTIRLLMGLVPAVLLILASATAIAFPISRESHAARVARLGIEVD